MNRCKPGESGCWYGCSPAEKRAGAFFSRWIGACWQGISVSRVIGESELAQCRCLYCGPCILWINDVVWSVEPLRPLTRQILLLSGAICHLLRPPHCLR